MDYIFLDFETYYEVRKPTGATDRTRFSLSNRTYEEYIYDPDLFKVHSVQIQINDGPVTYYGEHEHDIAAVLARHFPPGNDNVMISHNMYFDGAILAWHYRLRAAVYYCTKLMAQGLLHQNRHSLAKLCEHFFPDNPELRKGTGLIDTAGVFTLDNAQHANLETYGNKDTYLCFRLFKEMWPNIPDDEMRLIAWTLRTYLHPAIETDVPRLTDYLHAETKRIKDLVDASGVAPSILRSAQKFVSYLRNEHDIEIPKINKPKLKDPHNMVWALAKTDVEYHDIQAAHPDLQHIWDAHREIAGQEPGRAKRVLAHTACRDDGRVALPLLYCGAHTKRFSGTNKINPQNFKSGSEIRRSLMAPEGYEITVADLSNIEGRMLAWFADQKDKLQKFHDPNADIYNDLASVIYGRPIERKRTEGVDENGDDIYPDFTEGFVGKTAELGLGYGMGASKFRATLAAGARGGPRVLVEPEFAQTVVDTYRTTNFAIRDVWYEADTIIYDMARGDLKPYTWRGLGVVKNGLILPNGLVMTYPGLRMQTPDPDDPQPGSNFEYWNGKFWATIYGGKLIENIIQALARIILTDGLLRVDDWLQEEFPGTESQVILTVHDENLGIHPEGQGKYVLAGMIERMVQLPDWCNDGTLVLAAEGGTARNYSK